MPISPVINEYIYQPDPIKNINTSRVNIYKIQRHKKGGIGNFKNYFKINLENNNKQNQYYSSSETDSLKNSFFSYFNKNFFRGNNPLSNNNDIQMAESSNSSFHKFDTNNYNNNQNNNYIKKNNPLLKKSLSFNNNQLTMTLNSIAINIKKIENNIKSTLRKLVYKNKVLDKNNEKIKEEKEKEIMSYSSKNKRIVNIPNYFSYSPNKKNMLKYKSNNNLYSDKKINLRKIPLYKKYKISISPNKNFQCTILSSDANKMIKDYANKFITQRNVKENPIKKLNKYSFMKSNEKNNKILSLINKNKNKSNHINSSKKKKLNKSYNLEQKSDKKKMTFKKIDKNNIYFKDNNKNNKLVINKSFNKLFKKTLKSKIQGEKTNKKMNNQIIPIQNNLNINFYSEQNKPKIKNSDLRIMTTNIIMRKLNKDMNQKKFTSQSNSINSLKELNEK